MLNMVRITRESFRAILIIPTHSSLFPIETYRLIKADKPLFFKALKHL